MWKYEQKHTLWWKVKTSSLICLHGTVGVDNDAQVDFSISNCRQKDGVGNFEMFVLRFIRIKFGLNIE